MISITELNTLKQDATTTTAAYITATAAAAAANVKAVKAEKAVADMYPNTRILRCCRFCQSYLHSCVSRR